MTYSTLQELDRSGDNDNDNDDEFREHDDADDYGVFGRGQPFAEPSLLGPCSDGGGSDPPDQRLGCPETRRQRWEQEPLVLSVDGTESLVPEDGAPLSPRPCIGTPRGFVDETSTAAGGYSSGLGTEERRGRGGMAGYLTDGLRELPKRFSYGLAAVAVRMGPPGGGYPGCGGSYDGGGSSGGKIDCDGDGDYRRLDDLYYRRDLASSWNSFVRRRRVPVLLVSALMIWPAGLYSLPRFTGETDSTFRPVGGTPSAEAVEVFRRAYGGCGGDANSNATFSGNSTGERTADDCGGESGLSADDPLNPPALVVLDQADGYDGSAPTPDPGDVITDGRSDLYFRTRAYALGFERYLKAHPPFSGPDPRPGAPNRTLPLPEGAHPSGNGTAADRPVVRVTSFYSLEDDGLGQTLARATASSSGRTTVMKIAYSIPEASASVGHLKREYINSVLDLIEAYGDEFRPAGVTVGYTGLRFFQRDLTADLKRDMRRMDVMVLPLALLILCLVLGRGLRMAVVPLLAIFTTVAGWATAMWVMAHHGDLQVTQFTPSVMMSLTVGTGIDYSLFILSRVSKELDTSLRGLGGVIGNSPEDKNFVRMAKVLAIETAIRRTGHVVLVSGVTLTFAFLGLTLLPLDMLRGVGVGAAVAVASGLATNLTLVPALLHTRLGDWALGLNASREKGESGQEDSYSDSGRSRREARCCPGGRRPRIGSDASSYSDRPPVVSSLSVNAAAASSSSPSLVEDDRDVYTSFRDLAEPFREADEEELRGNGRSSGSSCCLLPRSRATTEEEGLRSIVLEDRGGGRNDNGDVNEFEGGRLTESLLAPRSSRVGIDEIRHSPLWYRLSSILLHPRLSLLVLLPIIAAVIPIAAKIVDLKSSIDLRLLLPEGCPSLKTYDVLGERFGPGTLGPYRLVFDGRDEGKRVDTEEAFNVMHSVIMEFVDYDMRWKDRTNNESGGNGTDPSILTTLPDDAISSARALLWGRQNRSDVTTYTGIATVMGFAIPRPIFEAARVCAELSSPNNCPVEVLHALATIDNEVTSSDRMTTFISAVLPCDPFSDEGIDWLLAARERLSRIEDEGSLKGLRVALDGGAGIEYDSVRMVYSAAPSAIAVTLSAVLLLVGLSFGSIVSPLRSVLSICLTISFAYGLLAASSHRHGEVCWIAPLMAFSVIVGLGLDYDVFLVGRILEFRLGGRGHSSSISGGLAETAWIIAAAGVIMAVAFGGLTMSASPALRQWAMLLTSAVLFDTLVVRILVVPILLGYMGEWSWWPRALPEGT